MFAVIDGDKALNGWALRSFVHEKKNQLILDSRELRFEL
jgi:hypothetical protein